MLNNNYTSTEEEDITENISWWQTNSSYNCNCVTISINKYNIYYKYYLVHNFLHSRLLIELVKTDYKLDSM